MTTLRMPTLRTKALRTKAQRMKTLYRSAFTAALAAYSGCAAEPADAPSLDDFFANAVTFVDLTHSVSADAPWWPGPAVSPFVHDTLSAQDYGLTTADLLGWEEEHGPIPPRAIVLMRSGWSDRWDGGDTYYNRGDDGRLHFPGFTPGAARFLVEQRDVTGIGVDTGSVDPGSADGFPVHGLVNGSGAFHLENLADLTALPPKGAWLIVAPIKIQGGSGGQVRVIAALPG